MERTTRASQELTRHEIEEGEEDWPCFGSGFFYSGSGSNILGWIPIRIRIQGFNDQKLKKIHTRKKIGIFWSKFAIYLSLGLHKGHPSYRRSLQPSKKNIQHFKTWNLFTFFYLCRSFLTSWIRIHCFQIRIQYFRLNTYPDPDPGCWWPKIEKIWYFLAPPYCFANYYRILSVWACEYPPSMIAVDISSSIMISTHTHRQHISWLWDKRASYLARVWNDLNPLVCWTR